MKRQPSPPQPDPPAAFLARMAHLLGDEYPAFAQSLTTEPVAGLRVNTLKVAVADFQQLVPFALRPVGEYEAAGFIVNDELGMMNDEVKKHSSFILHPSSFGRHPYHAAGLYYLQEPSAMVVASLLRPRPGERVLDLAAAPGGKSTHLLSLMGDEGLLVANEVEPGRVSALVSNLERWGAGQVTITQATPEKLAVIFGAIFDKVLLDAPCSGEALFRRLRGLEWSENIVRACARRQTAILAAAARLVRPGGRLAYSTCAFSPAENERVVARFLAEHPDYELVELPTYPGFADGRPDWVAADLLPAAQGDQLRYTVRLWPHRFPGEGQFIALLRRHSGLEEGRDEGMRGYIPKAAQDTWQAFAQAHLS
ncbi:MAG: RsmB/NOP family class I SAM-dependent RNA methyltransferase, partial [Chloroflexota bacterium]